MTDQQDENKLDENRLIAERRAKLDNLREQGGVTFPNAFRPADKADDLQADFGEKTKEQIENESQMFEELRKKMSTKEFVEQYEKGLA